MYLKAGIRAFFQAALIAVVLVTFFPAGAWAQQDNKNDDGSGEVYEPGPTIKPPKLIHYVEPAFSAKSKEAFVEGTVKISTVITTEGTATNYRVVSGLNAEEDRTALEALKQWRFQPGTKDGKPVKVRITVEVDFHLL